MDDSRNLVAAQDTKGDLLPYISPRLIAPRRVNGSGGRIIVAAGVLARRSHTGAWSLNGAHVPVHLAWLGAFTALGDSVARSSALPFDHPFAKFSNAAGRCPSERGTGVSEEQKTRDVGEEFSAKTGLEILFASREPGDGLDEVRKYDVPKELRERFWIRQAKDAGGRKRPWTVAVGATHWIERRELGRDRNQPGDGFRYVYRLEATDRESRAEWFEVTEVFEGVEAKDIEAFMLVNNGETADSTFDPDRFLRGLDMGIPSRAAQRRAADSVIEAVERKLNRPQYEDMWRRHGYGTLIVGLPLWFAGIPTDPLRVQNVIDDFMTRVTAGLKSYARQLKKGNCPFWRIVVVWMVSRQSLRELRGKVRYDVYDDPAYRKIDVLQLKLESHLTLQAKIIGLLEEARMCGATVGGVSKSVAIAKPKKRAENTRTQLPPRVEALKRVFDRADKRRLLDTPLERAKWHVKRRALQVLCFLRLHGRSGLSRWAATRLSPYHRIMRLAMREQARQLYVASRRRQATKDGSHGGETRASH